MMQDVIFEHALMNIGDVTKDGYLCHAYCHEGECSFSFNGKEYVMTGGDCLISASQRVAESHQGE